MFTDTVKIRGDIRLTLLDEHKKVKQRIEKKNLIVNTGKELIAARLAGNTIPTVTHLAVGTNSTAPVLSNTALLAETARVAFDSVTTNGVTVQYLATLGPGVGTGNIQEAALLNNTTGTMLNRAAFTVFEKFAGDTLIVEWNVTIL
jgi:hypothetical protein